MSGFNGFVKKLSRGLSSMCGLWRVLAVGGDDRSAADIESSSDIAPMAQEPISTSVSVAVSKSDFCTTILSAVPDKDLVSDMRIPVMVGAVTSSLFLFVFCAWSGLAPLSGSVVAGGQVTFRDSRQGVQAIDGGQIKDVFVKEGEHVEIGQPLVRFDDTDVIANDRTLYNSLFSLELTATRLKAELGDKEELFFDDNLINEAKLQDDLQEMVDNQLQMFFLRASVRNGKRDLLLQSSVTLQKEEEGLILQLAEERKRLSYLESELFSVMDLVKEGYAPRNKVLDMESRRSEIMRSISNYETGVAKVREEKLANNIKLLNLRHESAQEIERELLATKDKISELREKKKIMERNIHKTLLLSPRAGVANNFNLCFVGSVVRPGENLMEIVSHDEQLIVEAHLQRDNIDAILDRNHDEQLPIEAKVRFPAYSGRWRRPLQAVVFYVAADTEMVSTGTGRQGANSYLIKLRVLDEELARFPDIRLYPGMAAEVFVATGSKTLLAYLFEPIMGVLRHSMAR